MTDSGGLQIITQGKTITDSIKKDVYNTQGRYSDTALSFDEIPLSIEGISSKRLDISNRWFDKTKFVDCAKLTGQNVYNQIKTFIEMETKTKPIFIAQGNDYDTYMKWTEIALNEIPKDLHKYINGVAMGAPCLGNGTLEDIKRAFYFSELPIDTNRLHILGIGALKRMAIFLIFSQNGLYNNLEISYDSTTHSSGVVMGRTYINDKIFQFGRELNKDYKIMFDAFSKTEFFPNELNIITFHEILNTASKVFEKKHGSRVLYIKTFVGFLSFSISNFITHMEKCFNNKNNILGLAKNSKERNIFNSLYQIRNYEDFLSWERNIGKSVKSQKISSCKKESTCIEDLF